MENTMRKFHDGTDCGKVRTCNMRIFSRNMEKGAEKLPFWLTAGCCRGGPGLWGRGRDYPGAEAGTSGAEARGSTEIPARIWTARRN